MKLTLITAGLFASSSILTASASPHNRRRGPSGREISHHAGTVSEISNSNNDGTSISKGSEALSNAAVAALTMKDVAVLAFPTDVAAEPTTTVTSTVTATATATPTATPASVKRGVQYLGSGYRGRGRAGARSEEGEVDMLAALLNHSFEHEPLRLGGECSPGQKKKKGCAGNSVVECGSEGVWELVADCTIPGLDLVCRAVRERDIWKGDWAVNVICLQSDLVQ
ncbi:unnamed protein product [Tuber melanosporum]|uniref:(Perigord truffle) hypothetical protein n=1 Tax=Tuber melanosporum (strain Mel28) TaxID=656061 RepID=D5GQ77_TUBMM|nr:uncharacterized protein GSTUM_00012231001 [Tuber melanosporum]CAZ86670.1 unnamed protein product [Tuber melanosporum]